jgi:hypothetical protein
MSTTASRRASAALDQLLSPAPDPERARAAARDAWLHLVAAGVREDAGPDWWDVAEQALRKGADA